MRSSWVVPAAAYQLLVVSFLPFFFFLGSIYIDRGPLNETRPSSSLDAEPPRPLKGISSWFDRGPRPGAIRTATMQASTQAIEPSRSAECLHMRSGTSERGGSRLTAVLSKVGVRGRKLWQVPTWFRSMCGPRVGERRRSGPHRRSSRRSSSCPSGCSRPRRPMNLP